MGGSPATTTSVTQPLPWEMPAYGTGLNQLMSTYFPGGTYDPKYGGYVPPSGPSQAPNPYAPGQVAPLTPQQQAGMGTVDTGVGQIGQGAQAVGQGAQNIFGLGNYSPIAGTAGAQDIATAGGAYLGPNPALNAYYNAAAQNMTNQYQQATAPGITAAEVQAGGLGGSGGNQAEQYAKWGLGQNLSNLAANVYEPAYEAERGRMMQATGLAPSITSAQYIPSQEQIGAGQALAGVGGQTLGGGQAQMQAGGLGQTQQQNVLNTAQQNLTQHNLWPYQLAQRFASSLGFLPGGSQTVPNLGGSMK